MSEMPPWVVAGPDGAELLVHVRPGAAHSAVAGIHAGSVCVRVGARPVEGAANRELLRTLATALGVRPATLWLRRGVRGREKRVVVAGLSPADLVARLEPLLR